MSSFTFQLKAFRHFLFVCLTVFILAVMLSSPGHTESTLPKGVPVYLAAEQIKHDQNLDITIASGKVEITQGGRILFADTLTYNESTNSVIAKGNVTLLEPEGHVFFADYVELTNDMRDGVIEQLRVRMEDDSLLAANGARKKGPITHMSKAVYSPCEVCKENPERPPLWQIKANQVIHDNESHQIEYKDAFLEMFGVPVLYLPYFSHADPTIKHRSGFLAPSFGGGNLGFTSKIPYYFAVNPQTDVTLVPIYTADQGPVLAGEFRKKLKDGKFEIAGSITQADRTSSAGVVEKDLIRGHLEADGRFNINRTWRWGFDAFRATDDTYLRLYEFDSEQVLTSRLYAEGFRGRNYASFDSYHFQDLRPDINSEQTTQALPVLDYNFVGNPSRWGDYWTFDTNLLNLAREEGVDSRRFSVKGGWHRNFTNIHGHVFDLAATLRGDIYDVKQVGGSNLDENPGRIFPQLSANWRFPLQHKTGATYQLIEPIASVVLAPNGGNPDDIPNEDSLAFEFDYSDLFIPNRFVGLDRVEGGKRVDYGIRLGTYGSRGGSAETVIGQSYRLRDDSTFGERTGLEDHFSDLVGNVQIRPGSYFDFLYRFRINKKNLNSTLSDLAFGVGPPILRAHANYLDIEGGVSAGNIEARKEISFGVNSQFHKNWKITANATRDLTSNGSMVWMGSALTYEDECFTIISNYGRSFTRDRDLEPTNTVFIQLVFKNLGTVQSQKSFRKFSADTVNPI